MAKTQQTSQKPSTKATPKQTTTQQKPAPKQQTSASTGSNGAQVDPQVAKALQQMREKWNQGKEPSKQLGGGTTLPPGRHICQLTNAALRSIDSGPAVIFEFKCIEEGENLGEQAVRWANMDTEERLLYLQKDLRRLGVDLDEFEITDLPTLLEQLIADAPTVRISIKEKDGYLNAYVDKLVSAEEAGVEASEGGEGESGEEGAAEGSEEAEGGEEGEEAEPELQRGDDVKYLVKGKPTTGTVKNIREDGTVDIKNDVSKKIDNVDISKVQVLANPVEDD